MIGHRTGDNPLFEAIVISVTDAYLRRVAWRVNVDLWLSRIQLLVKTYFFILPHGILYFLYFLGIRIIVNSL